MTKNRMGVPGATALVKLKLPAPSKTPVPAEVQLVSGVVTFVVVITV
jgi:hypothetical protein